MRLHGLSILSIYVQVMFLAISGYSRLVRLASQSYQVTQPFDPGPELNMSMNGIV